MSQLAIYRDDSVSVAEVDARNAEPAVYSFQDFAARKKADHRFDAAERARLESQNQRCPLCRRSAVESIELRDGYVGRNGAMIPGTGTLVGFSCHSCGHEWPS